MICKSVTKKEKNSVLNNLFTKSVSFIKIINMISFDLLVACVAWVKFMFYAHFQSTGWE